MSAQSAAKLYTLPILRLTTVSDRPGPGFLPVDFRHSGLHVKYWRRRVGNGKADRWTFFPRFPMVLCADGSLWEPACLWLLDRARANRRRQSTLASVAQGLKDYKSFLDERAIAWDDFSQVDKYLRPTYLYKAHLQELINAGEVKRTTAQRRMSTVVAFYRFARKHPRMRFEPLNEPWVDTHYSFQYKDSKGFKQIKEVVSTDVSIRSPKTNEAWDGSISDGGKLRPLPAEEQRHLVTALQLLGNIEYSLMHYVALLTGAREQTVLTLRLSGFLSPPSEIAQWPYKLLCGPGTGIDTKRDVSGKHLVFSRALYERLHTYAISDRARNRRGKSRLGDSESNYLFLTSQGNPYYESKDDINREPSIDELPRRSSAIGQNLREFIVERVIPEVRKHTPKFKYKFHDLRATFGLNWVDHAADANGQKEKYIWARDQLRKLMWHKDATTTDQYLDYRSNERNRQFVQQDWSSYLVELIAQEVKCRN